MKILVDFDTDNLLSNTTAEQDKEIIAEFIDKADDATLVNEVIDRELYDDLLGEIPEKVIIDFMGNLGYEIKTE